MVSVTKEKRGGTVRINISAKEFDQLIPDDANRALVLHWIKLGRQREQLFEHLDEIVSPRFSAQKDEIDVLRAEVSGLKDRLERYIMFFIQVAHTLTVSTTANSHFELESIHFDKKNGGKISHESEQTYKLATIKHSLFKELMSDLLPDLDQQFSLTNFIREKNKDA